MHSPTPISIALIVIGAVACGPHAHIPPRPISPVPERFSSDSDVALANQLAPVLYLQRDETFPLSRVVANIHPTEHVIAYHLLWRDDAHGAWLPFTIPTDEELVWVGYDASGQPDRVWTYWHGVVLGTDWRRKGHVAINVQWGKHGSLPRGIIESDLPAFLTLNTFFAYAWLGIPDLLLGRLVRKGPSCFCHGYRRYREFTRIVGVANHLDAVVRSLDADDMLGQVFGRPYSKKPPWPPEIVSRGKTKRLPPR